MARAWSHQKEPHRELFVDPGDLLRGDDVRALQAAYERRRQSRDELSPIVVDGEYGAATHDAFVRCGRALGALEATLDAADDHGRHVVAIGVQRMIRYPGRRSPAQLARAAARKIAARPSPRAVAVRWARAQAGTTENPPGSNRGGKITEWQQRLGGWLVGLAWCGVFAANALLHAGVKGVTYRLASVSSIEDDAKAGHAPFRGWSTDPHVVLRGDLAVMFGRGVHVELVDEVDEAAGVVHTIGGNTSSGPGGSQSNGGGVFRRTRSLRDVHGFALVDYPG